MDLVQ